MHFLQILSVWFDFKPNKLIINHQLKFGGTMVKYLDHEKRAYKLITYLQKPLINALSGVSRGTICLKVVQCLLQLAYFVYAETKALARSCIHAGSSEPSPYADM